MPLPEDSRPFTVLKQHAEDFKASFEEDIKSCLNLLDSKLSSLIRDPGAVNTSPKEGHRLSVDIQFTRAKYDIFVNMKSLFGEFESSWREQLEEMKNNFLENVEILLAKTKLIEKELQNDMLGTKKSLKTRKGQQEASTANTSFMSPSSLIVKAKRLPSSAFNSFLSRSTERDEDNDYFMNDVASKSHVSSERSLLQSSKSLDKITPPPKNIQGQNNEDTRISNIIDEDDDDSEEEIDMQDSVAARSTRNKARNTTLAKQTPTKKSAAALTPVKRNSTRSRKSILKPDSLVESELHTTPSRSTRKRTAGKDSNLGTSDPMECEENDPEVAPKTSKNVHFSVGLDIHEDLEIYSPDINITRSAPRRKTAVVEVPEDFSDMSLTPNIARFKSKRKTIAGSFVENTSVAPSPKRFKSSRKSIAAVSEDDDDDDLLKNETVNTGHYSPWILLEDLDGKVPSQPGVYELKVYKAKKSAYIGSCENLRNKLTLHKLGQNSGHKHLDKYLERNKKDIQVRYEIMLSAAQAKQEEMKRIKSFVEQYRTTPSYN